MRWLLLDVLPWALSGEPRDPRLYVLSLGLLVLGAALALLALRLETTAVALAGAGVAAWLLTNRVAEGAALAEVRPGNGLTVADVAAVPVILLVAILWWRGLRRGAVARR